MKIKICGLSRIEDIDYVNEAKVDYAGFIFAKSIRQVTDDQARILKDHLNNDILAVGVFVNDNINHIEYLVNNKIIDIVQLHGSEDEQYINSLKELISVPIIKAIKVESPSDLDIDLPVDYYLLDNKIPGSGKSFDWSLIKDVNKPFFLAGGINIENVDEAKKVKCYGLDISSGVESNKLKDQDKINEIVRRIRDGKR